MQAGIPGPEWTPSPRGLSHWSNLKWGEGDSPSLQGPGNGLTCGSQGHWGPRCEKPLIFDAGSFRKTSDCSRHIEVCGLPAWMLHSLYKPAAGPRSPASG